ncbi:MAG: hypothetical protein GQF41_0812 [Candidatus Rifleibacterium amylolyticum]|nr:MAG: hypothetical protein GQF41_0812 [Candidatus Rifleibacterium amylolyticum]NLF97908.1 hypothetical protein [Candidatus Riflebacteria bacterium]
MLDMINGKKGVTIVEICVYAVIFAMFMGMATGVFFWAKKSLDVTKRTDDLQDLRVASTQINTELSYGNRVLFPPVSNRSFSQILFMNDRNELVVFFRDEDAKLKLINYEKFKAGEKSGERVIARNTIEFQAERPDANLIKYFVRITDEKNVEHVIANAVKMRNTETNGP